MSTYARRRRRRSLRLPCLVLPLEQRVLFAGTPANTNELTVLLRGQSNSIMFDHEFGRLGAVREQVQQLLGYDGVTRRVNLVSDTERPDGRNTLYSGTGFVTTTNTPAWVIKDASGNWTHLPGSSEDGILSNIRSRPVTWRTAPAVVVWMHSEYDSTNNSLSTTDWVNAVRYDARMVRQAFGGYGLSDQPAADAAAARIPYLFVNVMPYGPARDNASQAIRIGMQQLSDDTAFNAKIALQSSDTSFDYDNGDHMSAADCDVLVPRMAAAIANSFAQYAQPGSPMANAAGHVDELGPQVVHAQASGTTLTLTLAHDVATGIQTLGTSAAGGSGWSLANGSGPFMWANKAEIVDGTHLKLTFASTVPVSGTTLHYAYGRGKLGRGNAIYDNNGFPVWTLPTGVAINASPQSPEKNNQQGKAVWNGDSQALPSGWSDTDIGTPARAGAAGYAAPVAGRQEYTVLGSGAGITGTSDQFNYASTSISGNQDVVVRLTYQQPAPGHSTTNHKNAMGGLMLRDSTAANSAFAMVNVATFGQDWNNTYFDRTEVVFTWRSATGANASTAGRTTLGGRRVSGGSIVVDGPVATPTHLAPVWLRLNKSGSTVTAYYSTGVDAPGAWTQLGSASVTFANTNYRAGLAVTSSNTGMTVAANFDNCNLPGGPVQPTLPDGWSNADIGGPSIAGSTSYDSGTAVWTVKGSGADIWNAPDQFQFASRAVSGNQTITARIDAMGNTDGWAKSGVMFRDSADSASTMAIVARTPSNGLAFQYRSGWNTPVHVAGPTVATPVWVRLARNGSTLTASYSTNGSAWTTIGTATLSLASNHLAGLAVSSHNNAALNTTTFSSVSVTPTGTTPTLPTGWSDTDINGASPAGSGDYLSGVYTIKGGGADVWSTADQFNYASTSVSGDQVIVARVTRLDWTHSYAKGGVMFRDSTAAGSAFAMVNAMPNGSIEFLYRASTGASAGYTSGVTRSTAPSATNPVWLRLARSGSSFTASYALGAGTPATWTTIATQSGITFTNTNYRAGLAVCSHAQGTLTTATFDNVNLSASSSIPFNQTIGIKSPANSGYYLSDDRSRSGVLYAGWAQSIGGWEQFTFVDVGGGYVAIRSNYTGGYVAVSAANGNTLQDLGETTLQDKHKFTWVWVDQATNKFALRSLTSGFYVSADATNGGFVSAAWAQAIYDWETFQF